jgi:hypothetical protein
MKLGKLDFPNWPPSRLIVEACRAHNALHPGTWVNAQTSSWELLYPIVMAFLRHELSTYDESLRTGNGDRDQLQIDISISARKFYPWLRKDKDPRVFQSTPPQESGSLKIFNALSRYSCDLRSERAQLLMARRKYAPGTDRQLLDGDLREVNRCIDRIDTAFKTPLDLPPEHKDFRILILENQGDYFFASWQLPSSYIKPTAFACDICQKRVWRSKVPIDLGAGIKLVTFVCFCLSFSVATPYAGGVKAELWHYIVSGERERPPSVKEI